MIWIVAGTQDGRELAGRLQLRQVPFVVSAVSPYGARLLDATLNNAIAEGTTKGLIHQGAVAAEAMEDFIDQYGIQGVVDASHPYAENVSRELIFRCEKRSIPYLRFERQSISFECSDNILLVEDVSSVAEAVNKLASSRLAAEAKQERCVFITLGSRQLNKIVPALIDDYRVAVRVLPSTEEIQRCQSFGLGPGDIIAMQGPFSVDLNKAIFASSRAWVLVTKESGQVGGFLEKINAAAQLGIPVVVVKRPDIAYPKICGEIEDAVQWAYEHSKNHSQD